MSTPIQTQTIDGTQIVIVQINRGRIALHPGVRAGSGKRKSRIGQAYEVRLNNEDGQALGVVERRMLTRERKVTGRRYVEARWESPGWVVRPAGNYWGRARECFTKKEGVATLVHDHQYN